jgi:hypothetical protein
MLMIAMTMLALWSLGQNLVFVSEEAAVPGAMVRASVR